MATRNPKVQPPSAQVGQVPNPRLVKRPPAPVAASPPPAVLPPAPVPPPVFRCVAKGCAVVVRYQGQRCAEHLAAWLAKRYHAPEHPGDVFVCIVPTCDARTPHRDFICARHWAMVEPRRRWKIKRFANLYRVFVGLALEEVAARESESGGPQHLGDAPAGTHESLG